jgi:hypothetical protein
MTKARVPRRQVSTTINRSGRARALSDLNPNDGECTTESDATPTTTANTATSISQPSVVPTNTDAHRTDGNGSTNVSEAEKDPTRSLVWDYATKMDNEKAKCHKCQRDIGCKGHSTSGLRRHLYSCLGLQQFKTGNGRSGIRKRTKLSATVVQKFNSLVFDCIIKDGRSFGDLRKPGLARLLSEMLPGRREKVVWECPLLGVNQNGGCDGCMVGLDVKNHPNHFL